MMILATFHGFHPNYCCRFKLHGKLHLPSATPLEVLNWASFLEPLYRAAEQEWKAFIEVFTDLLTEADPQIPHLPPKDVVHRIYRDVSLLDS